MKDKIVLFGAGKRAETLIKLLNKNEISEVVVFDNDSRKWGSLIEGVVVEKPQRYEGRLKWCITIANERTKAIVREQCVFECGLKKEDEFSFYGFIFNYHDGLGSYINYTKKDNDRTSVLLDATTGFILGGVEVFTFNLFEGMKKQLFNQVFLVTPEENISVPEKYKGGVLFSSCESFFSKEAVLSYIRIIEEHMPCSVLVSNVNEMLLAACIVKKKYKIEIRICAVVHNEHESVIIPYTEIWDKYKNIDVFIGVSHFICEKLKEKRVPGDRLECMVAPVQCISLEGKKYNTKPQSVLRIGFAGRMDGFEGSQKRLDLVIKYIMEIEKMGINYRFELAGDGKAKDGMKRELNSLGLRHDVVFMGRIPHDDMNRFWEKQDICINLSDYEGHSITQMEAMANGVVPILTDVSGVRDDVEDGVNGYIVPKGDYLMAAERTAFLNINRYRIPQMGEKAHQEAQNKGTQDEYISRWIKVLSL